jgi:recombinational DNA repair protein (RecF pathway)
VNFDKGSITCDSCQEYGLQIDNNVAQILRTISDYKYNATFAPVDLRKADQIIKNYVTSHLGKELPSRAIFS